MVERVDVDGRATCLRADDRYKQRRQRESPAIAVPNASIAFDRAAQQRTDQGRRREATDARKCWTSVVLAPNSSAATPGGQLGDGGETIASHC